MREQINQYCGKKIVSQYDDSTGTSSHIVHEIKGDGEAWQNAIQMGNHHAVASILKKETCWDRTGEFDSLAKAIKFAKEPLQKEGES